MKRLVPFLLFATSCAAAAGTPSIRLCIGPLVNHSSYQLPIDKLKADFVSQLNNKDIKAINIAGNDIPAEMAKNNCDYLVRGEFDDFVSIKPGETVDVGGIAIDGRKRFALRFSFELKTSVDEKPVYSDQDVVIDKNPKTCGDDNIYDAVLSVRAYFKKRG